MYTVLARILLAIVLHDVAMNFALNSNAQSVPHLCLNLVEVVINSNG